MRKGIHPTYYPDAKVTCACGNTWATGSTRKEIRTEVCSKCHPFFTGQQQRLLDMEGQVDRFYKRVEAHKNFLVAQRNRDESRTSPERPIAELALGARPTEALSKAGITTVGQFMTKLVEGEAAVLAIEGFGRKSLIDLKKKLRTLGYEIAGSEETAE